MTEAPRTPTALAAETCVLLLALRVAASGLWAFHPSFALAKGAGTFLLLVLPLDLGLPGLPLTKGAIRTATWQSSLAAVAQNPVVGVGASPYLAEAADRPQGGTPGLWDAHLACLSVLGQFRVVVMAVGAGRGGGG